MDTGNKEILAENWIAARDDGALMDVFLFKLSGLAVMEKSKKKREKKKKTEKKTRKEKNQKKKNKRKV